MPAATKGSKKNNDSINNKLQLVARSGKFQLGYKSVLKCVRSGKAKLILVANNCSPLRKSELEYYAMLSKTTVHHYQGSCMDLGTACGKYFGVSAVTITDAGDSDILRAFEN
ncbi:60S ribosomal protein [Blastocystis sp. subtype 4]|uniref:60S ribosomal protein n=1 Tax=Blastocystis sp. subtype 4 TaxID=944170 RepID=UPI00071140C2|nr:60S ribosomal protein [Blastocystis sp. subtype 4]KNB45703.1 60S ribosomal protein [Blastocystis sp. subtype 4]|eukprot:XP_014529146.1 60S ribosomal protein [Blastocystis sp. subtype 4]